MMAAEIASVLGDAHREGRGWRCRCPLHGGRSLVLRDGENGRILATCWGGCDRRLVIAELQARDLWGKNCGQAIVDRRTAVERTPDRGHARDTAAALAMWESAVPALGTPVETYLVSRGLDLPPTDVLRFHIGLKHPSGSVWPAMVALVANGADGTPVAIHRTFLRRDGKGKAPVHPQKMMRGPCRGGAVRLAGPGDVLMVGEGIETCLAAMQAIGNAAWAALSTSGLRSLGLPHDVLDVIVLADGDEPGEAAARDCARRWKRDGRRVRIARPPQGMDFNDLLVSRGPPIEEIAR